jgi:hypothetical protein
MSPCSTVSCLLLTRQAAIRETGRRWEWLGRRSAAGRASALVDRADSSLLTSSSQFDPFAKRRWSTEDVIDALQAWARAHRGHPPSKAQWTRDSESHPSHQRVRDLFGTWGTRYEPPA